MASHPLLYLSALLFGSLYVPQKLTRDLPATGFNLTMAAGVALSALPAALLGGGSISAGALPPGLLSGLLWVGGNLLLVESAVRIGMARAFLLFSFTSIHQFAAGLLLLGEGTFTPLRAAGVGLVVAGSALAVPPDPGRRSRSGALMALASTLFFGLFYVPLAMVLPEADVGGGVLLLGVGALLPPVLLLALRGGLAPWARAGPRNHLLGLSSGLLFTLGQLLAVAAIRGVGLSVGAPVINGGLVTVSTLWGVAAFREVPRSALPRVALACGLIVAGIALMA